MKHLMVALVLATAVAEAGSFTLVENGKAKPVVIPANAEESTKLAATEWTNYVAKATGVALEVKSKSEKVKSAEGCVIIGTLNTLKDVPEEVKAKLAESKSYEASVTFEKDGNFWIVGKDEVAEVYGVCRTLEDQLGIRWFKAWEPDDPGDYVPEAKGKGEGEAKVVLDGRLALRAPYFQKRRLDMTGSSCAYIPYKGVEWVYRAGLQAWPQGGGGLSMVKLLKGDRPGKEARSSDRAFWDFYKPRTNLRLLSLGGGHMMLCEPIPAKKYFKDHPEYFAEVDGKRVPGERYCLSNPEVQHLVAQHIIKVLDVTGGKGEYLFGLMDGRSNICECKECRALDDEGAKHRQLNSDISTRFNKVVKNIAEEVLRAYPDTDALTDWVYSIYGVTPPKDVKHDPRVGAQFCVTGRCYGHHLDDPKCPINRERYAWLKGWMNVLSHGYTYEYAKCSNCSYSPYDLAFASDIKLYVKLGLSGWKEEMCFVDSTPPGRFPSKDKEAVRRRAETAPSVWQWFYLASRLTWDPTLDAQAVLDEIEAKYYGAAYPAMKKYHALRRKLWDESTVCLGYPRGDPRTPTLLNVSGAKEELLGYLDEADALLRGAGDVAPYRVRVAKDRRWLNIYWIEPNEELQAKAGKAFRAPTVKDPPTIDGRGDDKAWGGAYWTGDFLETRGYEHKAPPAALATSAAILSDAENLYFLFRFREPTPEKLVVTRTDGQDVYMDDSLELMLFPPSEANTYFQVCVNAKGAMTCYEQPQTRKRTDLGVVAKASIGKDEYLVELKVPVAKMYPLQRGDLWRVQFARTRQIRDELTPKVTGWTIDAGKRNSPSDWRPMEIGLPYLSNGSFEKIGKDGLPENWRCTGDVRIEEANGGHVVRIPGTSGVHHGLDGELGQKDEPRKLVFSFRAKGQGRMIVRFFRYHDDADPKAPHGYRRDQRPSETVGIYDLTDEWKSYFGEYVIRSGERATIRFQGECKGVVFLDDVVVRPVK